MKPLRKIIPILFLCFCFIKSACQDSAGKGQPEDPILHLADPTIFYYQQVYYLYGTVEGNTGKGFLVYLSEDLKKWKLLSENNGYALKKEDVFGVAGFWAPQVFTYNNKFYMTYTANEHIAIAVSDKPYGPFIQKINQALKAPVKQIDPFVFIDDDGKKYLYHVRLIKGNRIFVAEMEDDFSAIKEETLKECITASEPWENTTGLWPVAEGPTVLKQKGIYYLFYSANDFRNPGYAVGYATSSHPLGPWVKYAGNPILNKELVGHNGSGHGDFFLSKKQLFYVFHTHHGGTKVSPRKTALIKAKFSNGNKDSIDSLIMDKKSFHFLTR